MKNIFKIILSIALLIPSITLAVSVNVNRLNNDHIEPLVRSDFIKARYFTASSTSNSSTFPYASTTAISSGNGWFTGNVGIGTTNPSKQLSIAGADNDYQIFLTNASGWSGGKSVGLTFGDASGGSSLVVPFSTHAIWSSFYGVAFKTGATGNYTITSGTGGTDDVGLGGNITPSTLAGASMVVLGTGNVGIGSTTPGTLLSLGNVGGTNLSVTSTSTFATGINLKTGCFAINGVCVSGSGGGGSSSGAAYPFTPTTNYGVNNQATTGIAWFQNGLNASSTSNFDYASTTSLTASQNIGIGTTTIAGAKLVIQGTTMSDKAATTSVDLSTGWTSTGWTGSFPNFTHTTGNTSVLSNSFVPTIGEVYRVQITQSSAGVLDGDVAVVAFAGQSLGNCFAGSSCSIDTTLIAGSATGLTFTPASGYDGALTSEVIILNTRSTPSIAFFDSLGATSTEMRFGLGSLSNILIGYDSGRLLSTGANNIALGNNALRNNTTGNGNIAIGPSTLSKAVIGSQTIAIGQNALRDLTTGSTNTVVGVSGLQALTTGSSNVSFGTQTATALTTGSSNVFFGTSAAQTVTTSSNNTIVGATAFNTGNGAEITAIGSGAMLGVTGSSGTRSTAVGYQALDDISSGSKNTCIGWRTCQSLTTGSGNIMIHSSNSSTVGTAFASSTGGTMSNLLNIGSLIYGNGVSDNSGLQASSTGHIGISTSTPWGKFSIQTFPTAVKTVPIFVVATSTTHVSSTPVFIIDGLGHKVTGGSAPVLSSCGTSPLIAGNDNNGRVTIGTGVTGVDSNCTVTFANEWTTAPSCFVNNETQLLLTRAVTTTTVLTFSVATFLTDSDVVNYHCEGY